MDWGSLKQKIKGEKYVYSKAWRCSYKRNRDYA